MRSPSRVTAVRSAASRTSRLRRGEVVHHDDLVQQSGERGTEVRGALDHVHRVGGAARQSRPGRVVDLGTAEQDARPAQVVVLEVGDGADGRVHVAYGDSVRRAPQGCGDGRLVALLDAEECGHGPEHPVHRVGGGQQGTRAVLAVQPELERFLARAERAALPLCGGELHAALGQPVLDVGQQRTGCLVLGVEALLARVEAGDSRLQRGEVVLGALCAADDPGARLGEPADLLLGRGGPAAQSVDLTVQPGHALAPVGSGSLQPGHATLLLGEGLLGRLPCADRAVERRTVRRDLGVDLLLLGTDAGRLGLQLDRVAPGGDLRLRGRVAHPFGGQPGGAAQPLAQAGQPEPGLLRAGQRRQVLPQRRLEGGLGLAGRRQRCLDLSAALQQDRLVRELLLQRRARRHQVVGHQPRPGVAYVGLHGLRPPGHLGLAAQRLELATDLAEQVAEPGEVALGGVQLAQRLLLALAVLEHPGGLLDEAAAVLGGRVQDRVELALPDDHVHLAPDAGVAEQLLHVEQPAGLGVDGVLRPAVAEHRAADRDLGVLDRERAVGVVDGQLRPRRGRAAAARRSRRR